MNPFVIFVMNANHHHFRKGNNAVVNGIYFNYICSRKLSDEVCNRTLLAFITHGGIRINIQAVDQKKVKIHLRNIICSAINERLAKERYIPRSCLHQR